MQIQVDKVMTREDWIGVEHGATRHDHGSYILSKALRMLLARNNLTHVELARLSAWCVPWGQSWLSLSQISYVRTGKIQTIGKRTMECLMWVNLRLAAAAGNRCTQVVEMLAKYDFGPIPNDFNLPEEPFFLAHPGTGDPLDAGGLFMVSLGIIEPEGLGDGDISNKEAQQLSRCLSKAAQSWIAAKGLKISDGMTQIFGRYPVKEEARKTRLRNVIFEIEEYTGEQFAEEKEAIAGLLALFEDKESMSSDDVIVRLYQSAHS